MAWSRSSRSSRPAGEEAKRRIRLITADVEVGKIYEGRVARIMDFGAFVTILPGRDGLVHISQICEERVQSVSDKLKEGDQVRVKVLEVDKQGRIRLSMKAIEVGEISGRAIRLCTGHPGCPDVEGVQRDPFFCSTNRPRSL